MEVGDHPVSKLAPYLWDAQINIKMAGKISRISSRYHSINIETSDNQTSARISFNEQ